MNSGDPTPPEPSKAAPKISPQPSPSPAVPPTNATNVSPLAPPTSVKTLFQLIMEFIFIFIDKPMLQIAPEIGHLSPVIFTMGGLFLSIITLNYPVFLFSVAAAEATVLHSFISSGATYFATPYLGTMTSAKRENDKCKSYFQVMTPNRFSAFLKQGIVNTFPSTAMYFIAFASAYCIQAITMFSAECSELGPAYSNRAYISIVGACMFIILYALYMSSYGCEGMFTLLTSTLLGGIVGSFLCFQNYTLFGKQGVDLLFIPPLVKRSGMDYICVSTS